MALVAGSSWFDRVRARFPGRLKGDEWIAHTCPYCGNPRNNFQVNIKELVFHCWAGGEGGSVRGLFRDFDLPVGDLPDTSSGRREYLPHEQEEVQLPTEAQDVLTSTEMGAGWAREYLTKNRRMSRDEVVSYGIKFAITGDYAGRVIVPLYEGSDLVYFVSRAFMRVWGKPYKYPAHRRRNLTPVFLGESKRLDLVLVEGFFEVPAIRRLGYSVMPLLGKAVTPGQMRKLQKKNFERYIVLLDHDSIDTAVEIAEGFLKEGLKGEYTHTSGPDSDSLEEEELLRVMESVRPPSVLGKVEARLGKV